MSSLSRLRAFAKSDCTPARVCAELASIFYVRTNEVALLRLQEQILTFLFPTELRSVGAIPLSSSAIAARTAKSRTAEVFNNFTQVRHHSVFELIKLSGSEATQVIQKLMSAPVIQLDGMVLGVIQISRKGVSPAAAGPDFNIRDLVKLEVAASEIGKLMPKMVGDVAVPMHRLKFRP